MITNDKKLYKITNRLGTFYIVATSFDQAADTLTARLDQADYGFFSYREVPAIEHVATQHFYLNDSQKQSFSDKKDNLIIVGDGNTETPDVDTIEEIARKNEEMAKLKHELEEKDQQYNDMMEKAEKAYSLMTADNERLKEELERMTIERDAAEAAAQELQEKLDCAMNENKALHDAQRGVNATTGAYLIAEERERQISDEGYSSEHDHLHPSYVLAKAGVAYALLDIPKKRDVAMKTYWPWERAQFKPKDKKRNLIRAGALIAAAIDRMATEEEHTAEPVKEEKSDDYPVGA